MREIVPWEMTLAFLFNPVNIFSLGFTWNFFGGTCFNSGNFNSYSVVSGWLLETENRALVLFISLISLCEINFGALPLLSNYAGN